jgi:enoyl-CoA hydratase/carnithine racemase
MSIKVSTLNGVATVEIARPEKKNALTFAMYEAMENALHTAGADNTVRAVLITGQPGVFTSGNDLQDFMQRPPGDENSPVLRLMRSLIAFEKPVIAAVSGAAVGIGVTMLLHCDLVYVSDDAQLAMPFVSLGLVPEFAASALVPLVMGHVRAAVHGQGRRGAGDRQRLTSCGGCSPARTPRGGAFQRPARRRGA